VADEVRAPDPAAAAPRDPEALRAYLLGRLADALDRPRLLGAEGVRVARGLRAYLTDLDAAGVQKLSDCLASVEAAPADAAGAARPVADAGARDRLVRCIDATLRRPLVLWGQDRTDMQNHRGYLQALAGDDLRKLEAAQGEAGVAGPAGPGGTAEGRLLALEVKLELLGRRAEDLAGAVREIAAKVGLRRDEWGD
jgi:hypothetical protein